MEKHPAPRMGTQGDVVGKRLLAFLLDGLIITLLSLVFILPAMALGEGVAMLMILVLFAASIVYVYLLEGIYGYTPGKNLLGLVVVKSDGTECTIGASVLRNLLLIVDQLPFAYILGVALLFITDKNQRVGDLVADTVVVERQ